jgi:MFS family permease
MSSPDVAVTTAGRYAEPRARQQLQRRTLGVVVASQVLGGAGLAAGVTVGALLAEQMLGTPSLTGLPAALFTLGSALAAYLVGRLTQRRGRRLGLALGFGAGGLGALGVVLAAPTCKPATPAPTWPLRISAAPRSPSRWSPPLSARSPAPTW